MLYNRKDLPEINYMKHRHDDNNEYVDYEKMLLDKSLSPYMYENDIMNGYLKRVQVLTSILFDQMNVMKNFKNYLVDKYYYKHNG
jgi:hypothetical protein